MGLTLNYESSELSKKIEAMPDKLRSVLLMYATTKASQIRATMKSNRPWTDRTGLAKMMLDTVVSQPSDTVIRITLVHGVYYGIWLELANEQNYAIIIPTIEQEGPRYIEGAENIMSKITV